ncbi:MAG: transcriptional regulator [Tagaea sp.]|nr:transcriptional regulator [Tagaea sp.]
MTVSLKAAMAALPKTRRARIERRAAEIALEEMDLRGLRRARARTQTSLARKLGVGQEAVSRAEARGDLLLSTLRAYVAALGGELDLIVRFKDRAPVSLRGLKEKRGARKAA